MADERQERYRKVLNPFLASDEPDEEGEFRAWCPLHDDDKPSASINFDKNVWNCFAGCGGGSVKELANRVADDTVGVARGSVFEDEDAIAAEQESRADSKGSVSVSEAKVAAWHEALLSNPLSLKRLMRRRGLTLDTVKEFELGWDKGFEAYVIPVRDESEDLITVRFYRLDAPANKKSFNVKGAKPSLYPLQAVAGETKLLVTEGEMDALLAIQHGIPAITGTAGAGTWKPYWNEYFVDKDLYIVYDCDSAGKTGARKVANSIGPVARSVRIVDLDLPEKGDDLTDWFVEYGNTVDEFRKILEEAPEHRPKKKVSGNGVIDVEVLASFNANYADQNLRMTATITGRRNPPYLIPRKVHYECSIDAGAKCQICPMAAKGGAMDSEIDPANPVVLDMLDVSKKQMFELLREHAGAVKCNRLTIDVNEKRSVEELFVRPSVEEMMDEEADYTSTNRKIYSVGRSDTLPNQTVRVVGTTMPNPQTQRNEFLAWEMQQTTSNIDTFQVTEEVVDVLRLFQPAPRQRPLKKMGEIARDLSANVTRIYGRDDMHIAMDLVFHSVVRFNFAGKPIDKGWLELLIVGDTRTGKSEVASKLSSHYRAGKVVSCESVSFAGVVGGLQQFGAGKEWAINWGVIPINDRRLVVLDEVGGLTQEQIGQMSSIRSSGVAQLTKIQSEQTMARTRLIWLGNPRRGKMADYTYGVHAILPLIGNQEDVARFDMAMSVATGEVDAADINREHTDNVSHKYTPDACHTLLMWVWSRRSDQVVWAPGAEEKVYEIAVKLGKRYVEDPPLIQVANVRMKVARLAVALAARTFSTDETHEKIVVKKIHVQEAVRFLDYIYSKRSFGYFDSSREALEDHRMAVAALDDMQAYLIGRPGLSKFLRTMRGSFRSVDLQDMMNISKDEANAIINTLWKARMVSKEAGEIRIMPLMHQLLREVRD